VLRRAAVDPVTAKAIIGHTTDHMRRATRRSDRTKREASGRALSRSSRSHLEALKWSIANFGRLARVQPRPCKCLH
jgi:hypothetical protein